MKVKYEDYNVYLDDHLVAENVDVEDYYRVIFDKLTRLCSECIRIKGACTLLFDNEKSFERMYDLYDAFEYDISYLDVTWCPQHKTFEVNGTLFGPVPMYNDRIFIRFDAGYFVELPKQKTIGEMAKVIAREVDRICNEAKDALEKQIQSFLAA